MTLNIHPDNPEGRKIQQVVEALRSDGVIIYPTDTVYGLGCDIMSSKALERICRIRNLNPDKAMLTFICQDISQVAEYAWQIDKNIFKLLKRNLPGPFTFILRSSNAVPKLFRNRKKTVGIRIPDNQIALAIVQQLGRPILSVSLKPPSDVEDDMEEYYIDPFDIREHFERVVDIIVDGGEGGTEPSTLVDCISDEIVILREGKGELVF